MRTVQDREEIGGNRYIVTPLAHIQGYRIDIMMAEYFHGLGSGMSRFLQNADEAWLDPRGGKLTYSPYMLHWIRIIDTAKGHSHCLNRDEAQAFALLFGLCNGSANNTWLLADIIALGIGAGSFCRLIQTGQDDLHAAYYRREGIQHFPEDWKMAARPEYTLGKARYACIAQPAIRDARADYCVLSGFDGAHYLLDMYKLPLLYPYQNSLVPSDDRYFWLRYIDCGTGASYCLSNSEADAFIMYRHRHCWGRSIHSLQDINILSEPKWTDSPSNQQLLDCLENGSISNYFMNLPDQS